MKSIVSGAAGFIGSHLCERLLEEGWEVIGIDDLSTGQFTNLPKHPSFTFLHGDINQIHPGENFKDVDYIFHLAAKADIVPSIEDPFLYHHTNVTGTIKMLEFARKLPSLKRFVYAASSSCYGIPSYYPSGEQVKIECRYPYALTKWMGELAVLHWSEVYKIDAISLRLFNVFGPRARTSGAYGAVFGVFLAQLANGKPITIVGSGNQSRDFVFVTDVAEAFYRATQCEMTHKIYNICSGKTYKINYLADLLGAKHRVYLPERPGEPKKTHGRSGRSFMWLGWKPKISFEEGVEIMKELIPNYEKAPLWTSEKIEKATESWFRYLS